LDPALYRSLCRYLGLCASEGLYDKVARALQLRAAAQPPGRGFAFWLAELRPCRLTLGFLDTWTRLLWPAHPWRQRLNAVLAVHECDATGYREMMTVSAGRLRAWLGLAGIGLGFAFNLAAGGLWLLLQGVGYALFGGGMRRETRYFAGRTVLVTGAARGLGLALTARLLALGARVMAVARPGAGLQALESQVREAGWDGRLRLLRADLAQPGTLDQALDQAADWPLDTVILNAGIKEEAPLPQGLEALRRTFEVNVFAAMATVKRVTPELLASGRGHLVFISSQGRWHGMARSGAYNASKAALSLLAESLLMDLGEEGRRRMRVTTVEPGLLRTGMIQPGSLQDRLAVDPAPAASRILRAVARGRGSYRFPLGFTLLTTLMVLLPLSLRVRVLGGVKPPAP
jgi:1-deoxy-11beta-hydroxypentalenate dehydrogenase